MRSQYVMFLGLVLAAGTLVSLTFGGAWYDSSDISTLNTLTVFKQANILGIWSVTVPNIDFFMSGFKSLMMMDFAFFSGPLQILQMFFIMIISLGAMWGLYTVVIGALQGIFGRR